MEEEVVNSENGSNSTDKAEDGSMSRDEASNGTSITRARCKYGESCYRRNEDHKKQFSHPGDSDYDLTQATSTTPDNRQECKYGTLCYRKNPQHWKDFKHTSAPVVPVKKKRKKKVQEDEADQDLSDDYDYDDPFINDGSSDDYQPTSSGSDYSSGDDEESEGDMKRTLREGKRFAKR